MAPFLSWFQYISALGTLSNRVNLRQTIVSPKQCSPFLIGSCPDSNENEVEMVADGPAPRKNGEQPYEVRAKSCQGCKKGQKKGRSFAHVWGRFDGPLTVIEEPLVYLELSRRYHLESA
jgi:hypothetical protein